MLTSKKMYQKIAIVSLLSLHISASASQEVSELSGRQLAVGAASLAAVVVVAKGVHFLGTQGVEAAEDVQPAFSSRQFKRNAWNHKGKIGGGLGLLGLSGAGVVFSDSIMNFFATAYKSAPSVSSASLPECATLENAGIALFTTAALGSAGFIAYTKRDYLRSALGRLNRKAAPATEKEEGAGAAAGAPAAAVVAADGAAVQAPAQEAGAADGAAVQAPAQEAGAVVERKGEVLVTESLLSSVTRKRLCIGGITLASLGAVGGAWHYGLFGKLNLSDVLSSLWGKAPSCSMPSMPSASSFVPSAQTGCKALGATTLGLAAYSHYLKGVGQEAHRVAQEAREAAHRVVEERDRHVDVQLRANQDTFTVEASTAARLQIARATEENQIQMDALREQMRYIQLQAEGMLSEARRAVPEAIDKAVVTHSEKIRVMNLELIELRAKNEANLRLIATLEQSAIKPEHTVKLLEQQAQATSTQLAQLLATVQAAQVVAGNA